MESKENIIKSLTFEFALEIIDFAEMLEKMQKYVIAKQLLKSGTSIGANVREAQQSESRLDFIHKMKIATKEADETAYWLELCAAAKSYPTNTSLLEKIEIIRKILYKILSTARENLKHEMLEQRNSSRKK
ncbi:four helix bundle protein [Lentimicrobium saccharophilum]|uniref:Four helix bundle protein n=1 Tax=Lentimicrobium saccharophilum TaxID=1678841 RepID=A0A0S7BZB8_9BACT|nr:four helix bundle protein [Lentimicrobium saccharophilum]GAP43947.1 four helix bundle protein [Lentimicrobium saccharophilum]